MPQPTRRRRRTRRGSRLRGRTEPRSRPRSPGGIRLPRRTWLAVLIAAGAAAAAFPAPRELAGRAGGAFVTAVNAARSAEARHARIAASAARYGIAVDLARDIEHAAVAEGIDPELAFRLVRVESSFRERAVSPAGAMGLTQLMPPTADWLQPGISREEIFDRDTNLRLGFRYLRLLLRVYDGRVDEALHAYNRGPGTVDRIRAAGGDPANGYAERVLGRLEGEVYSGSGLLPHDRFRGSRSDR